MAARQELLQYSSIQYSSLSRHRNDTSNTIAKIAKVMLHQYLCGITAAFREYREYS